MSPNVDKLENCTIEFPCGVSVVDTLSNGEGILLHIISSIIISFYYILFSPSILFEDHLEVFFLPGYYSVPVSGLQVTSI